MIAMLAHLERAFPSLMATLYWSELAAMVGVPPSSEESFWKRLFGGDG